MDKIILKILILSFFLLFDQRLEAKITWLWSGVSGVYLTDQKTAIYFDPVFNRVSLWQTIFNQPVRPSSKLVENALKHANIKKIDAIFITHSHFDHAIDFPFLLEPFGAKVYGTLTTKNIGLSYGSSEAKLFILKPNQPIQIGQFKITPFKTPHAKILDLFEYCDGELKSPLKIPLKACDYRMGGNYSYIIEHSTGKKILFNQVGRSSPELIEIIKNHAPFDALFQGVANRLSTKDIVNNILKPSGAKKIIPIHQDNFFKPLKYHEWEPLWLLGWDKFIQGLEQMSYQLEAPKLFTVYSI